MQIKDIIKTIEEFAPLRYQESYDNSGIQVGNDNEVAKAILCTLDITEEVIEEAIELGCNMIISHHPLIFGGIKKISGSNLVERCIIMAIKNNITLYASHTNLDNAMNGVNFKIAEKLGLINNQILKPKHNELYKLYSYVPKTHLESLLKSLYAIGLGEIGAYEQCSFHTQGIGTFKPNIDSQPFIGTAGGAQELVEEVKFEILVPGHLKNKAIVTLQKYHPYEEVAYELIALQNTHQALGAGIIGSLKEPMTLNELLPIIRSNLKTELIKHTKPHKDRIQKIAICGGSGISFLKNAIQQNADLFITADVKYHDYFNANKEIIIADIGHYESEQFTIEIFSDILQKKFPNFAVRLSKINTNPVNYFY